MRVALLSTCAVSVPPRAYGGTELVIAELAKTLTRLGHDVTVFATGDSSPQGELRWHFPRPVWPPNDMAELRHAALSWRSICAEDPPFDIVHVHQAPAVAFSAVCQDAPTVLTLHHDRVDKLVEYYAEFNEVTYVAISQRQADLVPELDVRHVVLHGLDLDLYPEGKGGGWLAFIGRFAPEKAPDVAIDVALATGIPLRMGGKPHWVNGEYFDGEVKPRLAQASELVRWEGEVTFAPKLEMLRGAKATLFPVQWEEPFGLVMIESMLVGTPVVAFSRGAAPEVVEDGVTGYLVRNKEEMIDRVRRIDGIDRAQCRWRARERFGSMRMARDYLRVYEQAAKTHRERRDWTAGLPAHARRARAASH